MPSRARVLALVFVGAALILTAAWWGSRPDAALVGGRSEPDRLHFGSDSGAIAEPDPTQNTERSNPGSALADETKPATLDSTAGAVAPTGTLLVRVISSATQAPLANLPLVLGRERGGDRWLAAGTTDARGEARFESVEANTVIVEAQRTPPYARAFGAVWLEPGETETLVLEMTAGCTLRGRVVDDAGTPLDGARVELSSDLHPRFQRARSNSSDATAVTSNGTTSAVDGRFEIAHVGRAPRDVWIERGVMKPRQWFSPRVRVNFEDAYVFAGSELGEADTEQDLGDVVVPRARTWAGRVLDAAGAPVAGALVSTRWTRMNTRERGVAQREPADAHWPNPAGFQARVGEDQTDATGWFELRGRPVGEQIAVWTAEGRTEIFPLPEVAPGERRDDLELRLADASLLVLELVDAQGQRITRSPPSARMSMNPGKIRMPDALRVALRGEDLDFTTDIHADPDGLFRVQILGPKTELSALHLEFLGFAPVHQALTTRGSDPLRIVLHELPLLRLRVRIEGDAPIDPGNRQNVSLQACLVDPASRVAPEDAVGFSWCCGLGASQTIPVAVGGTDVEWVVQADRPFFVTARRFPGTWSRTFGPWSPGSTFHELTIPSGEPISAPSPEPLQARVRARITDARTGERIEGVVWFDDPASDSDANSANNHLSGGGGGFMVVWPELDVPGKVRAGTWRVRVASQGYRSPPTSIVQLAADVETDLGAFALEPYPLVEIFAFEADGTPVQASAWLDITGSQGEWFGQAARVESKGCWQLRAELGTTGFAFVQQWSDTIGSRAQRIAFPYDGSGRLELHLAPWHAIEVRCAITDPLHFECGLALDVRAAEDTSADQHGAAGFVERAPDADARRFTGWLTAGRYVVRMRSLMLDDRTVEFTVPADASGVVRVELP